MNDSTTPELLRMRTIVFLAVGGLLIAIGALLNRAASPILAAIAINLGIVTVAVVVVDQIWRLCGGRPIDSQITSLAGHIKRLSRSIDVIESSQAIGLESVHSRLGSFGSQDDWVALIEDATDQVDLMGRTLLGWTRAAEIPDRIADKVINHGVKFRVLLMHPENKSLDTLTEEKVNLGSILRDKLTVTIGFFLDIRRSLPENMRDHFQVRCFEDIPLYCALVRVDDRFYVTQYLYSASSDNSPFYCVHGFANDWPRTFGREFEHIWKGAKPPEKPEGREHVD